MGIIANTPYIALSIILSLSHRVFRAVDPEADEVHSPLVPGLTSTIGAPPIIWGVRVDTYYWQGHPQAQYVAARLGAASGAA
jgi:hypothetical protein